MRNKALHILSILLLTVGMVTTARGQSVDPSTVKPLSKIKIHGDVYGGGDQAGIGGNTNVTINTGEYGGSIYGGGNGALNNDGSVKASADIGTHNADGTLKDGTGDTHVSINGGEIVYGIGDKENQRNIYGGGNLACNVAGNTNIEMTKGMITTYSFTSSSLATAAWRYFYDNSMKPNQQKIPICSVFGAGYGAHTDVAGNTNVNINIPGTADIKPADGVDFTHAELEAIDKLALRLMPDTKLSEQFVPAVHGGGFDGTVGAYDISTKGINYNKTTYTSQTNITIQGQPFVFNVFGGGLGSKAGADATGGVNSYVGAVYGATKVDIQGGLYNGNVFGGGAGIESEQDVTNPFGGGGTVKLPYTYAAQVMRETDVTISGNNTIIYGNVYGGGDIANTGWYNENARPAMTEHVAQKNQSLATLDYTTSLKLNGGNILGSAFGGGNGRTKEQMQMSMFVGTVCGSTNVLLNGTKVWSHVYGGGNMGSVFMCQTIAASKGDTPRPMATGVIDGCTNVAILDGMVAKDIFGGGYGDDPGTGDANVTSADIYGNTYVYFEKADLEFSKYWKPREFLPSDATNEQMMAEVTGKFLDQSSAGDKRNTESDITHNLYGGGNMACNVKGNTHVYMIGAPIAPDDFSTTDYYKECIANVAKPHFSVFGGGFGDKAMVTGNAYSDINLGYGTGLHSIVGGGLNGTVGGECLVHVGNDPMSQVHFVYGGGYYAPCAGTKLDITRGTILENVYGGAVMGNIHVSGLSTEVATNTTIGLKSDGDNSSVVLTDENGNTLRSYTYSDHNNSITIYGDVYGGNDVSGTVNGIAQLTVYGGEIKGNVYGAGNGNHIGYYVPDELKYDLGTHGSDNYFIVNHKDKETGDVLVTGKTYVGRPQTIGGVNLTLEGNTKDERVKVLGQVFGGGNSCTIGAWDKTLLANDDPHVVRDDPDYFLGGGTLNVNLGSHVTIGRTHEQLGKDADGDTYIDNGENVSGLFMGCSGKDLATQNGAYTEDNYYHHFFDYKAKQYYPGFAVGTEAGASMTREEQLKPFQAYLNNIMVWSDNVHLNIPNDAEDIWLANFVGGGFRGSMRTKTTGGIFDYTLSEGVTVNNTIVGGAYNAHVQYHYFATKNDGSFVDNDDDGIYDYATTIPDGWIEGTDYVRLEYTDEEHQDEDHIKSIIRYNFNGGMLSENSTGLNSSDVGHHVHQVHADPRADETEYATAYFEPLNAGTHGAEEGANRTKLFTANKNKALLHLTLKCALEPEVLPKNDGSGMNYAHGGNVFGGCFMSGFVEGDSWVDYHCWLAPKCANSTEEKYKYFFSKTDNMHIYDDAGDLETNNALSVYGAGYGADTHSDGDVYLYIKSIAHEAHGDMDPAGMFPYIYNAFGGSNMGTVAGNTNVYYAVGKQGTLLGSLYGGGYKGVIEGNTFVEMAEGFAHNVYGGSRQADIHGASHVWAYDGKARGITDANHLIICNLYGGNDIAGTISGTMPAKFTESKWNAAPTGAGTARESLTGKQVNTYVEISADDESADRGFPLVGSAFAGGNGEAWKDGDGDKPNVEIALLEVEGGSTLRAFGGGNMATVTGNTYIFTNAESNNFANVTFNNYQKNIVTKVFFSGMKSGFRWDDNTLTIDPFHVVRLFGGNNLATMDIQPTWNLWKGKLENVYSGGNMGDMTYYNPDGKPSTQNGEIGQTAGVENNSDGSNANYNPRGLSITVDSPDIYINSLFGGCRVSDVRPDDSKSAEKWPTGTDGEDFYGATVNITDGYIENVYGGNDVSGRVEHGTNVNISGAVSGNVYGSGNGYYLYKYDDKATKISEEIDDDYGIYYVVPEKKDGELYDKKGVLGTDTHKLLTINEFRPSVEKAFLNIAGVENYHYSDGTVGKRVAYVKGNVFCGGNASTLTNDGVNSFTKFKIGSYVTLNGVFMGCDGYDYTQDKHISDFAKINGIVSMGDATEFNAGYEADATHNPILLNAYMMAVDMLAQPKDFNLNLPLKEAHIGTYCGGGNRGSMLVDKTVTLPFHHDIIIYDKIVAACLDANVRYNENGNIIVSQGGYTRPIANRESTGNNTKFKLDIASQFVPLVMDVPDNKNPETRNSHGETFEVAKAHDFLYDNRQEGVKYTYEEFNDLFQPDPLYTSQAEFEEKEGIDHQWKIADGIYAPKCNIYGGCYQSGEVEGDIELNIHSNMLRYVNKEDLDKSLDENIACFNIYGAGFGQDSHVWGDVKITLDRSLDTSTMGTIGGTTVSDELAERLGAPHGTHASADVAKWNLMHNTNKSDNILGIANANTYPSANNIIGGGRNGKLIGNSTLEIRNGLVYSDVAGGCYASDMYGSTHVIVGYPTYYKCNTSGEYQLDRADKWNTDKKDADGNDVIKQSVWYLRGDLVPENVYQQIVAATPGNAGKFDEQEVDPTTYHKSIKKTDGTTWNDGTTWDDVVIKIGKGIYGGGYSLANSAAASAGSVTTHKLADSQGSDLYPHNFNRHEAYRHYDISSTIGYGGNSSIMVGDQKNGTVDHIAISTLNVAEATIPAGSSVIGKFIKESDGSYTHQGDHPAEGDTKYYTLTGDGGIYGDGHLTFCDGFRAADVTRYGWAEATPQHPKLLNTFQRMDLLSVNDCCLMLQGAQDFATDQIDATTYSITRVNELRLNSTLDANATLGQISLQTNEGGIGPDFNKKRQRNYLAFFNNVHYLGSIVTNDDFADSKHTFHDKDGTVGSGSYKAKKQEYITAYAGSDKKTEATDEFKKRNVATARNAIGINNGYCLRIQNQEYVGSGEAKHAETYYGPVVGVCEVKLLTLVEGEGGGYVYADNIHANEDNFLMTSGNFVFPGIIHSDASIGAQYIVDDCFIDHFGTSDDITTKHGDLDEAHYWYVEGNKYFFTTTLTGFTYQEALDFNLIENDPNIILSGMENGSKLNIKKIEWLSQHRAKYESVLMNDDNPEKVNDYEFDIEIGNSDPKNPETDWTNHMPRHNAGSGDAPEHYYTTDKTVKNTNLPQFNIRLQDKLDNSGDLAYDNHLDEPELVKIYLEGKRSDAGGVEQTFEYTITVNIVYLQGPTFEGGVFIENCALPGELIRFSTEGLKIKTPDLMPITSATWKVVPLSEITAKGEWKWDTHAGEVIPEGRYEEKTDGSGNITGTIPALYKQNEYNIAYVFTAGGYDFPVMPAQKVKYAGLSDYNNTNGTDLTPEQYNDLRDDQKIKSIPAKENRMIVVHNYHRMKDVVSQNLQIETMPKAIDKSSAETYHTNAEAKIYIEDEADLHAFVEYLNMATEDNDKNIPEGLTGLDIILQKDIRMTSALPAISVPFAGTFHGDGYHIDLGNYGTTTFMGNKLEGKVYNLGLINGTSIASTGSVVNSYIYEDNYDFAYGKKAYELSHTFNPTTDASTYNDYVANYYANGDYQYATTDRVWSLRTGEPWYGHEDTRHDKTHIHDDARWNETTGVNDPLYDGLNAIADKTVVVTGTGTEFFTYKGLAAGYANDYLFFGQHLDMTSADAYPMHIEPVANDDADASKGGNRVYETAGYYQSKMDQQFYYNKDAWALYPELTAVDYTHITTEGDGANTLPSKFKVDSNMDYGTYSNATFGHVTQNLLVYHDSSDDAKAVFTEGSYADKTPESDVRYHGIIGNGTTYSADYFHLVDKQDFNAPIAFTVNTRAWYERMPQAYRNVSSLGYNSGSAWEGIVLPFTATKVSAEKNGEISHFYGDSNLHHEYWLRGFKGTETKDSKTYATFASPAVSGDDYFTDSHQSRISYVYPKNDYFTSLFNYNDWYDTRDDEGDDTMGNHNKAWYAESHTFIDYVPLTAEVPYIVAFPGDDFYEFSMESYYKTAEYGSVAYPQKATFEAANATIKVSDGNAVSTTANGYTHHGTFLHQASQLGLNAEGTAFVDAQPIVPFRTYMTTISGPSPAPTRTIVIWENGWHEEIGEEPDEPEDDLGSGYLRVWAEGMSVVIETSERRRMRLFTSDGICREILICEPGKNWFPVTSAGIYFVENMKLLLR